MTMTRIVATDEIEVAASPAMAWRLLADLPAMARWWPANPRLRILRAEPGLVGSELEIHPFGGRPFCCRVVAFEESKRLRMEYFGGFISGRGEWRLEPAGSGTRVGYELDVQAEGRLVSWIGRVIPLGSLHSRQMQGVLKRLARTLTAAG